MKKVIVLFLIVLSFLLLVVYNNDKEVEASSNYHNIIPPREVIELPLNSNVESYSSNVIITGFNVNRPIIRSDYELTLNSLSSVNTSKVGDYRVSGNAKIKLQAISEKINLSFEVIFRVYNPEFRNESILDNYEVEVNQVVTTELFNINSPVTLLSPTSIQTNKVGSYKLTLKYLNEYEKEVYKVTTITVVDKTAPIINKTKDLKIGLTEVFLVDKYFEAIDNVDGNITSEVEILEFDKTNVGNTSLKLKVIDSSGNETIKTFMVEIYDDVAPKITFNTDLIELDVTLAITKLTFAKYVTLVSDNIDELSFDDVLVDTSKLKKEEGNYIVTFSITDRYGNTSTYDLSVRLKSMIPTKILVTDMSIKLGESITSDDVINNIEFEDNNDSSLKESLSIDLTNVNINVIGKYEVLIKATNYNNIESKAILYVTVYDDETSVNENKTDDNSPTSGSDSSNNTNIDGNNKNSSAKEESKVTSKNEGNDFYFMIIIGVIVTSLIPIYFLIRRNKRKRLLNK